MIYNSHQLCLLAAFLAGNFLHSLCVLCIPIYRDSSCTPNSPCEFLASRFPLSGFLQTTEYSRIAINRKVKRGGKLWIRVFPDKPITKKPAETRMGKGKGAVDHWVAVIRPGRILFEVGGTDAESANKALIRARYKLGFKTKIVARETLGEGS